MLVIAQHQISDPDTFWATAKNVGSVMPPDFKLHSVFPSQDLRTGVCVWEGPSAGEVQKFIDEAVGNVSKNFCYEVNVAAAVGVPEMQAALA